MMLWTLQDRDIIVITDLSRKNILGSQIIGLPIVLIHFKPSRRGHTFYKGHIAELLLVLGLEVLL